MPLGHVYQAWSSKEKSSREFKGMRVAKTRHKWMGID